MKQNLSASVSRFLVAAALAGVVYCSWTPTLDATATTYIDAGFQRALVSFASARALNAAISVAQGTEAAIQPAGVGITFTPGEVLDPLNDLVEQFSNLMLLATVSFGVQKMLISMGGFWIVSLLLSLAALLWSARYLSNRPVRGWLSNLMVVLLMIRFALPAITLGSELLFQQFMASQYQSSQKFISSSSEEMETANQATSPAIADEGILDRLKIWSQNIRIESPLNELQAAAERTVEKVINLMVIFFLQTLLLPLIILWVLYGVVRRIFMGGPRTKS